ADIAVAARRWARRRGFDLRITGVDLHPTTLDLARRHVEASGEGAAITLVEADALRLMDRFEPWSFDYVHAGMFLHHLGQVEVLTVLKIMDRLARRGIVWNDLLRSRASLVFLAPLLVAQPAMVRHDGLASIRAGFTPGEAIDAARRVGIGYAPFR